MLERHGALVNKLCPDQSDSTGLRLHPRSHIWIADVSMDAYPGQDVYEPSPNMVNTCLQNDYLTKIRGGWKLVISR